jgi:hypothetical protein
MTSSWVACQLNSDCKWLEGDLNCLKIRKLHFANSFENQRLILQKRHT